MTKSDRRVRVVVGDDHPVYREGVVRALDTSGRTEVVAAVGDGRAALDAIREHAPDVALLDYKMRQQPLTPPTTPQPVTRERSHKPVAHPTAVKYAAEMIGTLFLVFTIGTAVRSGSPLAPPAIGAILMAMVYAGGHISGAHYNPAVTLGALVRRRIDVREAVGYWISQLIGALLASAVVRAVLRRAECRHQQGSPRQLVLWAGDRLHRALPLRRSQRRGDQGGASVFISGSAALQRL